MHWSDLLVLSWYHLTDHLDLLTEYLSLVPHRHKTVKLSRPLMDTAAATQWNDLPDSIETVIAPIFTRKILFENQQNSTHKKKQ